MSALVALKRYNSHDIIFLKCNRLINLALLVKKKKQLNTQALCQSSNACNFDNEK